MSRRERPNSRFHRRVAEDAEATRRNIFSLRFSASSAALRFASWLPFFIPGVLLGIALIKIFNRPVLVAFYQSIGICLLALVVRYFALAWAMAGAPSAAALPDYLLRHVGATTPGGVAWTVKVSAVRAMTYLEQPYFTAAVEFLPPAGASARDFILVHDAVTHEVRNHVVIVVAEHDSAQAGATPQVIGALQYPARTLAIRR